MLVSGRRRRRDSEEDVETFGQNKRGDEMPDWAGDKQKRLKKIQQAMTALEADARLAAAEERRIEAEKEQQRQAEGRKKLGKSAAPPSDQPNPVATQLHPRSGKPHHEGSKDGFVQAYNAQAAVDAGAQIIVAHELDAVRQRSGPVGAPDRGHREQLRPASRIRDLGGRTPTLRDESNLEGTEAHGVDPRPTRQHRQELNGKNRRTADPTDAEKKIDDGGFENTLPIEKASGGTGLRPDQTGAASCQFCCGA